MEPDSGTTNIRKTSSKHWTRWIGIENRCAGLWVRDWQCVRKVKEGLITCDLFAFLTTEANAVVAPIHPKAMPVILRDHDEVETWLTAP